MPGCTMHRMGKRTMGTGSLYSIIDRRSGEKRWIAQVSIGGRTNRHFRKRVCKSERAARAALKELRADVTPMSRSRLTLSAYLEGWVRDVRNLGPGTQIQYANAIALHIVPTIGHVRLSMLAPGHVEAMIRALEPTLAPKSIRNVVGVLRRALTFAVRDDLVTRNVASSEYIDPIRVPDSDPRVLTADEMARLLDASKGDWLEGLIVTAAGTGLRQGELRALAWGDVDLEGGRIEVHHSLRRVQGATRKSGRYVRDQPKTRRSERVVPLAPSVVAALIAHRERVKAAGFIPISTGPVFPAQRGSGGPLSAGWVTHRFYALCEKAGIQRAPFKSLRATFASRLHDAGVPERRIQDLLGHKRDSRVTQKHYVGAGDWGEAVAAVAEVVG